MKSERFPPTSHINVEEYLPFPLDQTLPEKTALLNEINAELVEAEEIKLIKKTYS